VTQVLDGLRKMLQHRVGSSLWELSQLEGWWVLQYACVVRGAGAVGSKRLQSCAGCSSACVATVLLDCSRVSGVVGTG
jgi:hypothetical protein